GGVVRGLFGGAICHFGRKLINDSRPGVVRLHAQTVWSLLGGEGLPGVVGSIVICGVGGHAAVYRRKPGDCRAAGIDTTGIGVFCRGASRVDRRVTLKSVVAMPRLVADIAGCDRPGLRKLPVERETEVLVVHRPEWTSQTFQASGQVELR